MLTVHFFQEGWYEMIGSQFISAILKSHGFNTTLSVGYNESSLMSIKDGDIIAFSIMTGMEEWALNVAQAIKRKRKIKTVFGGPHATYFPELIREEGCDVLCRGEGEYAMLEFVRSVNEGRDDTSIKNLCFKNKDAIISNPLRELVSNLDEIPFPDRELYYKQYRYFRNNRTKYVIAGRGCPFSCTFCFNEQMKNMYQGLGSYMRWRSPQNVIDEIRNIQRYSKTDSIFFMDDTFSLNKKWLRQFLPLYRRELGTPFVCLIRADTIDEEICKLLAHANCKVVGFGIESGDEGLRNELLKKRVTDEQIYRTASLLKECCIKFMTFNMVGLPGETTEQAFKTIELNIQIGAHYPRCGIFTPYPGTVLGNMVKREDLLEGKINANTKHTGSIIKNPDRDKFTNINYLFQFAARFPAFLPLVKRGVVFPPNIFFKVIWFVMFVYIFTKSELRKTKDVFFFLVKTLSK